MLIKRKPLFWELRDVRKGLPPLPKSLPLPQPIAGTPVKTLRGYISHHILLPIAELPQTLLNRLRADLTLRNPTFEQASKYGKGFVSFATPEFVRFYSMDTKYLGLPRSIKMNYLNARLHESGLQLELEDKRPQFEHVTFPHKGEIHPLFFQKEAIDRIVESNVVIQLRCGRGKTILALLAVDRVRMRTLILVRTNILLKQWVEAIQQVFDITEDQIGVINGEVKREGLITVATEQSLVSLPRSEKRRIGQTYGHVVVDECLAYDTEIVTNKGLRYLGDAVKDVEGGKRVKVLCFNETTGQQQYKFIKRSFRRGIREVVEVEFEGGKIRCTPDHLFYVQGKGWKQAKELSPDDNLLDYIKPKGGSNAIL